MSPVDCSEPSPNRYSTVSLFGGDAPDGGAFSPRVPSHTRLRGIRKLFGRSNTFFKAGHHVDETSQSGGSSSQSVIGDEVMLDPQLQRVIREVKDFQINHGSLLKLNMTETASSILARPVNVSVFPTKVNQQLFQQALTLQRAFNGLYMYIASNDAWLEDVLGPLREHDSLLSALWSVWASVRKAGVVQNIVCGVFRSDYMFHQGTQKQQMHLKQVEMNTFSCAGACHSDRASALHRHLKRVCLADTESVLPHNENTSSIVKMLRAANNLYESASSRRTCVLMVVQPFNSNIADERPIEYGLWDDDVPCYRCEWADVLHRTTLLPDRTLLFHAPLAKADVEVSVIYYRAGLDASEYDEAGVATRLHLELSQAIKCPDVQTHLTTFKAVQQALTQPGIIDQHLPAAEAEEVRRTFMPMFRLDQLGTTDDVRRATTDSAVAKNYVLKPNLEGGGHNIYREEIPGFLKTVPKAQWCKYVLMEMINPPEQRGTLMTSEKLYRGATISELGIVGTCVWRRTAAGAELLENETAGWTLKAKPATVNEMSVVKGYGAFDCPDLVE